MRRLIAVCAAVLLAAIVGLVTLPFSISSETVRDEVTGRLAALTGYDVEVAGGAELHRFPWLRFVVSDVRLRPRAGAESGSLARMEALTGSVALMPLILGRIEVQAVALHHLQIDLEIDRQGRRNWSHGNAGLLAQAIAQPDAGLAEAVRIGDLRVENGSVQYVDRRSGERHSIEGLRATLSWSDLATSLMASGSLSWRGDTVDFNVQADRPINFLRRGSSSARISVNSPAASISFVGDAHLTDNPHLRGRLALSTGSARRLLRELGIDIGSGPGLELLKLTGQISLLGPTAIISDLGLTLDGNHGEGSLKVDLEADRIGLQGTLAFDTLNLGPYLSGGGGNAAPPPADTMTRRIDLSDLEKAVADIRVSANRVLAGDIRLGETAGTLTVRDGALTLGIAQTVLHGGIATGTVTVIPSGDSVRARLDANMEHIAVAELLSSFGLPDRLEGAAGATASLRGNGGSLGDILTSLTGEARLTIRGGAIRGIDIPAVIEAVSTRQLRGWPGGEGVRTAFDRLSGSLLLVDGVAVTQDARLSGPDIDLTLAAEIHLTAGSIAGRGNAARPGASDDDGPALAFIIGGSIAEPNLYVDPESVLNRARSGQAVGGLTRDELIDRAIRRGLERLPDVLR